MKFFTRYVFFLASYTGNCCHISRKKISRATDPRTNPTRRNMSAGRYHRNFFNSLRGILLDDGKRINHVIT